jgi:hypothetical protein
MNRPIAVLTGILATVCIGYLAVPRVYSKADVQVLRGGQVCIGECTTEGAQNGTYPNVAGQTCTLKYDMCDKKGDLSCYHAKGAADACTGNSTNCKGYYNETCE